MERREHEGVDIDASSLRWKEKIDRLAMRLVESWTRIGLLLLFGVLVAVGAMVVRPRRQGRRIQGAFTQMQYYDKYSREWGYGARQAPPEMDIGAVIASSEDAEGGGRKNRVSRWGDGDDGLDVEDTCALQ